MADRPMDTSVDVPAVSAAPLKDDEDAMDASVLMSSGYVPPLEPSQLSDLVAAVFDPNVTACLRHRALKISIRKHRSHPQDPHSMSFNTIRPDLNLLRSISTPPTLLTQETNRQPHDAGVRTIKARVGDIRDLGESGSPSITSWVDCFAQLSLPDSIDGHELARMTDHTQREERMAQVHLARWAADLQRALQEERQQYAALQDDDRKRWLQERLKERVSSDGTRIGTRRTTPATARSRSTSLMHMQAAGIDFRDPLGLLAWQDTLTQRSMVLARVVGSVGLAGAIMVWAMRVWGWDGEFSVHEILTRPFGHWSGANE